MLGEGPTQGLDDTKLTAAERYSISFTVTGKNFSLNLHYNESRSYLFVNGTEIIKFTANL